MTADAWIAVTDRLPEPGQRVLVYGERPAYKEYLPYVAVYKGREGHTRHRVEWWLEDATALRRVKVWQPLPPPPDAAGK